MYFKFQHELVLIFFWPHSFISPGYTFTGLNSLTFSLGEPLVGNLRTLRIFFPFPDKPQPHVLIDRIQTPPLSSQLSSILIPNPSEDLLS